MVNRVRAVLALALALTVLLSLAPAAPPAQAAPAAGPARVIHAVYDDSGSMYSGTSMWSQAKYAVEVFAAMLGENDTLNVYLMSDFVASPSIRTPRLRLDGSSGAAANVREVHDMVTHSAQGTPFGPVRQAHDDLAAAAAGEKWLVVLTDGEFNDATGAAVNSYFQTKSPDIRVFFLAIGSAAPVINQDAPNGVYFDHAASGADILSKITGMCTRIFNSNKLDVDPASLRVSFDVPMRELIVFAQGQNVKIDGITNAAGALTRSSSPVHVQYSQSPAVNYPGAPFDPALNGYVAAFSAPYPPGDYTLSLGGADTVEVYYKPDVEIDVYLTDADGQEISVDRFEAGDYNLNFRFVKSGTKERLPDSQLLGDITYSADVVSNGVSHGRAYTQGDAITLAEGSHRIDASALYLDYNTVSATLTLNTFKDKAVTLAPAPGENNAYRLTEYGFDRDQPLILETLLDGRPFTADEWAALYAPAVISDSEQLAFRAEKGGPGEILLYPEFLGDSRPEAESAFGLHDIQLSVDAIQAGGEAWSGVNRVPLEIGSGYRDIVYTPISIPPYEITADGIVGADRPIIVQAAFTDGAISAAQWDLMQIIPEATADAKGHIGDFRVEKTGQPGQYALYPTLYKDSAVRTDAVNGPIRMAYQERVGNEVWSGAGENGLDLSMTETRGWLERNLDLLIFWGIIALIALLILGYLPPFKKYLPRRLKRKPTITCTPNNVGGKQTTAKGTFSKSLASTLIPYKAETGTIRFIPKGAAGAPALSVRAAGGGSMLITNIKLYAGKNHITFNGMPVAQGTAKPMVVSAGMLINVKTDTSAYKCIPTQ